MKKFVYGAKVSIITLSEGTDLLTLCPILSFLFRLQQIRPKYCDILYPFLISFLSPFSIILLIIFLFIVPL